MLFDRNLTLLAERTLLLAESAVKRVKGRPGFYSILLVSGSPLWLVELHPHKQVEEQNTAHKWRVFVRGIWLLAGDLNIRISELVQDSKQ